MASTPGFRKSTPATPAPDASGQPTAVEAPKLTHGPCGTTFQPGDEGIAFAKRTKTYLCGRCGGPQAAWTFTWPDGSKLAE